MTTPTLPPLFSTFPDGSSEMVECFTELTFVELAELTVDSPEFRRPGRAFPRYELSASFVLFDSERQALSCIEDGSDLLVPCWMHPLYARTETDYSGNILSFPPDVEVIHRPGFVGKMFLITDNNGSTRIASVPAVGNQSLAMVWNQDTDVVAYPLVRARLSADSFSVESISPTIHKTNLTFLSDDITEPVFPMLFLNSTYADAGIPDWTQSVTTDIAFSTNSWDNGNTRDWSLRNIKKGVTVKLSAFDSQTIVQLRAWLLNQRGRWKAFQWVDPRDNALKTFRLSADVLKLKYINCTTMQTIVRFIEVDA